jgi:hypothetical protein
VRRFWNWLRGLFRRRGWKPNPIPRPFAKPSPALAAAVAGRVRPPPPARGLRPLRQVPATKEDIKRLGRESAVSIALGENARRVQRATIRAKDGELYVVWPGGTMVKTNGEAAARPDGTLIPLPPDPRPTKRERAKARRRLKREERK